MYLLVYFNLPSIFGIFKTGFNGLHTLTSLKSCKPQIIENESIMMLIQGSERLKIKNWLNLDKQLISLIKVFVCLESYLIPSFLTIFVIKTESNELKRYFSRHNPIFSVNCLDFYLQRLLSLEMQFQVLSLKYKYFRNH